MAHIAQSRHTGTSVTEAISPTLRAAGITPAAFVQPSAFHCFFSLSICSGREALIASLVGRRGREPGVRPSRPTAAEQRASDAWSQRHCPQCLRLPQSARSTLSIAKMVSVIGRQIGLRRKNLGAATSTDVAATAGVRSPLLPTTARRDVTTGSRRGRMARRIGVASIFRRGAPTRLL